MRFGNPSMLWLLLVTLPLLAGFLIWAWWRKQQLIRQFVQSRLLAQLTVGVSASRQKIRIVVLLVAVAGLLVALARPQWGFAWEEAKQRGLDIIVAIDTSRSMLAQDISPNRLTRSKLAALDLARLAKTDRVGLVAFAGSAFLQCPLTLDEDAFRQSLDAVEVGIIPQGGTAVSEAIRTSMSAFKEKDNYKALVIFTDGEDHESGVEQAAQEAAQSGLRIFTIGVGTPEGELLRSPDAGGNVGFIKDADGNVVKSHLNEALLKQIASITSGSYLPLRGASAMDVLYRGGLARLPKGEISAKLVRHYYERYHWPLGLAVILLVFEMLFPERKRVPRPAPAGAVGATLPRAAALCVLLGCSVTATASPGSALREYKAGHYRSAEEEYSRLLRAKPNDPRLQYNAGAAAYQAKRFDEAAKNFEAASLAPDLDLQQRAYYNFGNALYRLGEQAGEPNQRQKQWQESIEKFENALKLEPSDADAKHNLDLVRKKLEELKKQQESKKDQKPSPSSDKNKDDQKDQKDQEQKPPDQKQDQSKSDQQKDSQSKPDQKPDQKQANQSPEQKKDQSAKNDAGKKDDKKSGQQANGQKDKAGETNEEASAASVPLGQMTPQQARQLLDAQKQDEKALIYIPPDKQRARARVFKDW